ncbi:hypothetical protein EZS27_000740 [termite gut metagenome]|uniref:O-antigen ligase domain-containing protein n=1 Tax=termite gut metagenome TaxID=433724 RepID=A0A5J4T2Q6_9ZZZZ
MVSWLSMMQFYPKYNNCDTLEAVRFQRILFWGFFYTVFGGVIRKWIFPFGMVSNVVLLGQLLLPLLLSWQYSKTDVKIQSPYQEVLIIYILILTVMALNPLNLTIFHGIIGVVIHLGFWCLLLVYLKVAKLVDVEQLDNFLFFLLIVETVLASMQYGLPAGHILNRYAVDGKAVDTIGDANRTSGTFSYIGGFGALCGFYSFFCWYLINTNKKPVIVVVSMVLTLYCALMCGGRGPVFTALIILALAVYENQAKMSYYIKYIALIGAVVAIMLMFNNPFGGISRALDNWTDRTEQLAEGGEQSHRIYRMFFTPLMYHGEQPLFGAGLGSDYQGTNAMFGTSETKQQYGYTEEEAERIVFEGGYLLYFIRVGLFILVISSLKIKRLSKIALFILNVNGMIIFNIFNTFFVAMGFIWINQNKGITKERDLLT